MSRQTREYCEVAEAGCVNPAGYGVRGGFCENPEPPRTQVRCSVCGVIACAACREKLKGLWICSCCVSAYGRGDE